MREGGRGRGRAGGGGGEREDEIFSSLPPGGGRERKIGRRRFQRTCFEHPKLTEAESRKNEHV